MDLPSSIRQRYMAALASGMTIVDATAYANRLTPERVVGAVPPPTAEIAARIEAALAPANLPHPLDHDHKDGPGGSLPAEERGDVLAALRAEAEALGLKVDRRWGEAKLRAAIAGA